MGVCECVCVRVSVCAASPSRDAVCVFVRESVCVCARARGEPVTGRGVFAAKPKTVRLYTNFHSTGQGGARGAR